MKKVEIRISGLGGQGVVLAGQILGRAAVYSGKNAIQTQSYGAEARGSLAKSEVIISDGNVGFPTVRKCDILVAMNQEALDKHIESLKENGTLILDASYVKKIPDKKIKIFKIPATEIAEKTFGTKIYANMIMLGALNKLSNLVNEQAMKKAIDDTVGAKAAEINEKAYKKGEEII